MDDTRELLQEASRSAPISTPDIERFYRRGDAKRGRSRVSAAVVALVIAVGGASLAVRAITGPGDGNEAAAGYEIDAPTVDLKLGAGDYYYQRFDAGYGACESWWALDDSGRLATLGEVTEGGSCWGPMSGTYASGEFYSDSGPVAALSTDPEEILAQLTQRVQPGGASPEPYEEWGGPIEWGLIRSIGELLEAPDVNPEQKAALMVVASELSTSVDTQSTDPEGRPAILLTLDSEDRTHRWWFDARSHQPLVLEGFVVQAAGVVSSTESSDLDRSFLPELRP